MSLIFRRFLSTVTAVKGGANKCNIIGAAHHLKENNYALGFKNNFIKTSYVEHKELPRATFLENPFLKLYDKSIPRKSILDLPIIPNPFMHDIINKTSILDIPNIDNGLECPTIPNQEEKKAVRLIIIRRKKMNKHKLKKLRKRQRYHILTIIQRREIKKEKKFQRMLADKVKEAEQFSPKEYIEAKLHLLKNPPLNRYWNGKKLPLFIIRQLRGIDPKIHYNYVQKTQDDHY